MSDIDFDNVVNGVLLVMNLETAILEIQYCQEMNIFETDIGAIDAVIELARKDDKNAIEMLKQARHDDLVFERLLLNLINT